MLNHLRWFLLLLISIFVIPTVQSEELNLKVGVISGLTGMASKWNYYQNKGVELAVEDLAKQGVRINLVFEDSKSIGSQAVLAFNKLTNLDKVDAVVIDDFGFVAEPLLPMAGQQKKLLLLTSLPSKSSWPSAKGYAYSVATQTKYAADAYEEYFKAHPEIKKAAMFVFDDTQWGFVYKTIWQSLAAKYNVEIVSVFESNEGTPDFRSAIAKAMGKKVDLMLLAHEPITFSKMVAAAGYKGPILAANNFLEVFAAKEDLGSLFDGVYIADPEISAEFSQKYRDRFKEPPILEAYVGYEAIRVLSEAFKNNRTNPELGMKSVHYKGLAGEIDFTSGGTFGNQTRFGLFKLKDRGGH
ncbi:MAG: ABC transporter substrate-binding protein [Deltaproteobacteria bacterium]|nr:ABC transporter substrate-binding protein [Deltaproteobacteria bacterium]